MVGFIISKLQVCNFYYIWINVGPIYSIMFLFLPVSFSLCGFPLHLKFFPSSLFILLIIFPFTFIFNNATCNVFRFTFLLSTVSNLSLISSNIFSTQSLYFFIQSSLICIFKNLTHFYLTVKLMYYKYIIYFNIFANFSFGQC